MRPTLLTFFRRPSVLSLLAGLLLTPIQPTHAQSRPAPLADAPLAKRMRGEEALQALGNRVRDVAEFHRMSEEQLRRLFQRDKALWVNPQGRLLYICDFEFPQEGPPGESTNTPPLNPLYPLDQTFKLHSRPGASRTVFLDFDGHDASTTVWDYGNGIGNAPMARPFDIDTPAAPHTFSTAERQRIQYIWAHVAEDYIQYDIDVTTEDPGIEALKRVDGGDQNYGIRVGIGGDSADWFGSAGGVAYLTSFDDNIDLPCWVFPLSVGNSEHNIAVATSHEVGHTLGLAHDGQNDGVTEYYTGHGNWAPIMGVGYSKSVVQWSKGEYSNPSNTEDDLARMLLFGAINRADDHGNNIGSATPLTGVRPFTWGIINSQSDVDFFSFETGSGPVTITATPAPRGANLHILLSLYNSSGGLVTSAQVADSSSTGVQPVTISPNLAAGTYYVSIDGIGVGTGSTGYTDYSSIGQFTLQVTLPGDGGWTATPGGAQVWTNTANWSSSTMPFGLSAIARINNNISGDQNILIDTPVRIGGLLLGDADAANTFTLEASGDGVLQLGATNGSAWISKTNGLNDTITAPLQLLSDLSITNSTASDVILSGEVNGAFAVTKFGTGRLVLAGVNTFSELALNGGTVAFSNSAVITDVPFVTLAGGATLDASAFVSGWSLAAAQTLGGYGMVTGLVSTIAGAHLVPGTSRAAGTLTFADDLDLADGTVLDFDLTSVTNTGGSDNDLIAVAGDLTLTGTISVSFHHGLALPETNGTYTLLTYGGILNGGATNFVALNGGNRFNYVFDDATPGEIHVQISGAPEALVWQGDGSGNLWDVNATTNWLRGGNPDAFFQGDTVLFDTGSASPAINLSEPLSPASVIVSNTGPFTFSGSGKLSGDAVLTKRGDNTLTLATANDFTGSTTIAEGTIALGNAAALGATNGGTIITNSGQLNLSGFAVGTELITASGAGPGDAGAIINSGATQTNALRNLILAGDTTLGGSARWDLRGVPASNIVATLIGNGFALTKTGPNQIWLANLGITNLGDITVSQGTLGFEGANTITPGSATLTVDSGATLAFLNTYDSDFNRSISLASANLMSDSGHNNLLNTISLSGNNATSVGEASTLDLRGPVTGSGGFTKTGPGILRLAAANSFTGNLVVNAGTLMAGHNSALGATNGSTTIASGARLDVAAFSLGAEPISVGGSGINNRGAIINSLPSAQPNALRFVTLTAATTFGGNGRWDIRGNPIGALLGAFDLTKVARNEIWLANLGPTQLRNITINEGILGFQGFISMGNSANSVTVNPGGTLAINGTGTNVLAKTTVTLSAARLTSTTGSNMMTTTLSLTGSNQLDVATGSALYINGNIAGAGFFNKTALGTLTVGGTIAASGGNQVTAGTLQIGAAGLTGSLNVNLTNNGALIFNRRSDLTHSAIIAGAGTLTKQHTNVLTMSGANTYSGATTVSAGTLRVGNTAALGTTGAGTTIANGGTLDVNGFSIGAEAVTVTGAGANSAGAVLNSGSAVTNAVRSLTMTGNTTLGGNNRWDIRNLSGVGTLSSSGQPYALTKTGPNTIGLAGLTVDAALGNIAIQQGVLSVEQTTTGLGNPNATATVYGNAALNLHSLATPLNKKIVLDNDARLSHSGPVSGGVNSTVSGSITLSNGNAFFENSSTLYSLLLNNSVTGPGSFNKIGPGLVQLNSTNDYNGNTLVTTGTLKLGAMATLNQTPLISIADSAVFDVSLLGTFVLGPAQVLAGHGTVTGNVTANGSISPGTSIGQLTVSGNVTLSGNALMEVSKAGAVLANDVLSVSGTLTSGGTLTVTRTGDPLVADDSFRLFLAGGFSGSFASFSLPALDPGLAWDTSTVNSDGWVRVVTSTAPLIGSVSIINGEIVVTGTGGTPGGTYHVVTTTNLTLPMLQWLPIATNTFDGGGNFAFTNAVSLVEEQQYFRVRLP
ncbi:MAG TPA: autotransporter-associated beta strand repeat-containing protein [Verrucomicrobiae bacterium]|nr:autotransporter-associated beta strand repeat-containing protein [Verrucomicrobiae bacterium]